MSNQQNQSNTGNEPIHKNIEIQVPDSEANGAYANLAVINHHPSEFVMDFIYLQPNGTNGKVVSRIILNAGNAKKVALALNENLEKYERRFGEIKL